MAIFQVGSVNNKNCLHPLYIAGGLHQTGVTHTDGIPGLLLRAVCVPPKTVLGKSLVSPRVSGDSVNRATYLVF